MVVRAITCKSWTYGLNQLISFKDHLPDLTSGLKAESIQTLQVNIGLTCNIECRHCHVASSPRRTEQMEWGVMEEILRVAREITVETVDITGGAPEMNPDFREFVRSLHAQGHHIMVRTNLTILLEEGYRDLPEFFRDHSVHLVASLPCYLEENVDRQRGDGVYQGSVDALRILNDLGYGIDPDLSLDLVYNPVGPTLPPSQETLEEDYRHELDDRFGIRFTRLITITNTPIGQFLGDLKRSGKRGEYFDLLSDAFNPDTVDNLMCRHQISVNWNGFLFDCDFNLALRKPVIDPNVRHISDFDLETLKNREIYTDNHCLACTAGAGSSCGGALVGKEEAMAERNHE
ncbi:MAG: arsenosugar biosynthesis radical SAM protein ArsS [Candidatus Omnitrophica bacterium]|nr:arsenosugar biosynthesis radical SAM protein ArsS [Candidatus Omnitrophota bacterium]